MYAIFFAPLLSFYADGEKDDEKEEEEATEKMREETIR